MKRRNFLSVLSAAILLVSQGASASTHDLLHYQDQPQTAASAQSAASAAAAVKSLPHLWPPAKETKPKSAAPAQAATPSDAHALRAAWVPTAQPSPPASDSDSVLVGRDVADLPPCVVGGADEQVHTGTGAYACIPISKEMFWYGAPGQTVRTTLNSWAKRAGWTVVWQSDQDCSIPAGFEHYGQFEAAGAWVFRQLAAEGVFYRVRFYEGNKAVVVAFVSQTGSGCSGDSQSSE